MDQVADGGVPKTTLHVPGSDDVIVLLDPERRPEGVLPWHPFYNVLRVQRSGLVRWRAELVPGETTAKCWLGIELVGQRLRAWTYGHDCELDAGTGAIVRAPFTK